AAPLPPHHRVHPLAVLQGHHVEGAARVLAAILEEQVRELTIVTHGDGRAPQRIHVLLAHPRSDRPGVLGHVGLVAEPRGVHAGGELRRRGPRRGRRNRFRPAPGPALPAAFRARPPTRGGGGTAGRHRAGRGRRFLVEERIP